MPTTPETEQLFDLQEVIIVLQAATKEARKLDAVKAPVEKDLMKGDRAVAQANRDIQYLQYLCRLALTKAESVYWEGRGYPDPLE